MNLLNVDTIHKNKPLRLSRFERFMIFSLHNLAGSAGLEPANAGTKTQCLTTWRRPTNKRVRNKYYTTLINDMEITTYNIIAPIPRESILTVCVQG